MKRYICFLRAVNVSGKNKVAMNALVACMIGNGFTNVKTYLNSGNIIFDSSCESTVELVDMVSNILMDRFYVYTQVLIMEAVRLEEIMRKQPVWWGTSDKSKYHNLIMMIQPNKLSDFLAQVGESAPDYEQFEPGNEIVFWSFDRENYRKSRWWSSTAKKGINEMITIRTANTIAKIIDLSKKEAR